MSGHLVRETYKRIDITLPQETVRLLERLSPRGNRSGFVDRAVRFYVQKTSHGNLRKLLRKGAEKHTKRDLFLAEEWFNLE
ncbi:MAG TPA: hypothetical protein DEF00_03050 [Candidatus Taylorbacteria bacterium]|nr:MAG: hypothetical protein UY03_C0003G0021 [Parcubacteria group bacterium GW2011_GWA2_47_64]KKU96808.1 MAG: hypothetical protein UY29_C0006G0017 [Parcubacteria group bacterium GW2011_GWC2_48_17]HBV01343.1 hypothetical protein [Candidatus Taylorbacteria bacterium]